jgi:hypothetical protein
LTLGHQQVLDQIARGDFHRKGGLKCARLFSVERAFFSRLATEVQQLVERNLPSDVQNEDHVTNWTKPFGRAIQFSLLNGSGRFDDTSVDHDLSVRDKAFHHADQYPTINEFVKLFPHATNMRLNGMSPGGGLSPHEEHVGRRVGRTFRYRARFHLPISTNDDALMYLDGDKYQFKAGEIYFFNNGCIHSAVNHGDTTRFHLVWDMLMTAETTSLMFGDDSHPPLMRVPLVERDVPVHSQEPVREYQISGPGSLFYNKLHLDALKVKPYQWQNLFNVGYYSFYRLVGRPQTSEVR